MDSRPVWRGYPGPVFWISGSTVVVDVVAAGYAVRFQWRCGFAWYPAVAHLQEIGVHIVYGVFHKIGHIVHFVVVGGFLDHQSLGVRLLVLGVGDEAWRYMA